jgi:hypothetical protein
MNAAKKKNLQRRSKSRSRGAALVEAAVAIPVMLVFAGCIMFAQRSYAAKMDKQMGTRAGILYYASHNCEGEVPAGVVPPIRQQADPGQEDVPGGAATDPNRLGGGGNTGGAQAGISKDWNLAKASPPDTEVFGKAVQDRQTVPLNRMIHAESEVACNEKAFPNKWTAIIEFIGAFAQSGGGL